MTDKTAKPFTPTQERIVDAVMKPMSKLNTWLYRLSGGKLWGRWLQGAPILLLTTIGCCVSLYIFMQRERA